MTKPDNLVHNAYLDNLGSDYVAIAANGHPIGRAATEASLRQAVPDAAHYLTAKDLAPADGSAFDRDHDGKVGGSLPKAEPNPVSAGLDAVVAQQAPAEDVKPDADPDADDKAPAKAAAKKASAKK